MLRRLFSPLTKITKGLIIVLLLVAIAALVVNRGELLNQLRTESIVHDKSIVDLKKEQVSEIDKLEGQHAMFRLFRDSQHRGETASLRQQLSAQTQIADTAKGLSISRTLGMRELGCLLLNYFDERGEYIVSVPGGEAVVLVIETNSSEVHKGVRFEDSTGIRTEILWC